MNRKTGMSAGQIIGTIDGQQVVGLDIAKLVFQMHTVGMTTGKTSTCRFGVARGGCRASPGSGDAYVAYVADPRTSGPRACQGAGPWLEQIQARRQANAVIVAQAAKMACTIWAVTARQRQDQRGYRSVRPQAA